MLCTCTIAAGAKIRCIASRIMPLFSEEVSVSGARNTFARECFSDVATVILKSHASGGTPPCLYEVLDNCACRCLYLDIEWFGDRDDSVPRAIYADAKVHLKRVYSITVNRAYFFEACCPGKVSYHVHIVLPDEFYFDSPPAMGDFVRQHLLSKWQGVLDAKPYCRRQCWRLPLCAKKSALDRPLRPMEGGALTMEALVDCRIDKGFSVAEVAQEASVSVPPIVMEYAMKQLNYMVVSTRIHKRGDVWVFPSTSRLCPYISTGGTHHSNHLYGILDPCLMTWRIKCRSPRCADLDMPATLLPVDIRRALQEKCATDAPPSYLEHLQCWQTCID